MSTLSSLNLAPQVLINGLPTNLKSSVTGQMMPVCAAYSVITHHMPNSRPEISGAKTGIISNQCNTRAITCPLAQKTAAMSVMAWIWKAPSIMEICCENSATSRSWNNLSLKGKASRLPFQLERRRHAGNCKRFFSTFFYKSEQKEESDAKRFSGHLQPGKRKAHANKEHSNTSTFFNAT